jgi:hypothetical protein
MVNDLWQFEKKRLIMRDVMELKSFLVQINVPTGITASYTLTGELLFFPV